MYLENVSSLVQKLINKEENFKKIQAEKAKLELSKKKEQSQKEKKLNNNLEKVKQLQLGTQKRLETKFKQIQKN